jgi:hypothetical protein
MVRVEIILEELRPEAARDKGERLGSHMSWYVLPVPSEASSTTRARNTSCCARLCRLASCSNAARSSCFNTTGIARFGIEFLPSSLLSLFHCVNVLQKPVFLFRTWIKAEQGKVGGALRRKGDHFVEDLADGTDEVEQPGNLLSDGRLVLKIFCSDIKLEPVLCETGTMHCQVLPVNTDERVVLSKRKQILDTLRKWPLFSIHEKLDRIRTGVEKG